MGGFGGVVCLTGPVPSHHQAETGPGSNVAQNLVDNIGTVGTGTAFIGVALRVGYLLFGEFCFCGLAVIAKAPRPGTKVVR